MRFRERRDLLLLECCDAVFGVAASPVSDVCALRESDFGA